MSSFLPYAFLIIIHGLALGGFTTNTFIVAVIAIEWAKSRSLNSSELLLLSLSVSNICAVASVTAAVYKVYFRPIFSNYLMTHVINIIMGISVFSRFWFTAWLCVFYCIKIVNSTHSFFLWCKQRISQLLPWILAASAAISIICPFFSFQFVPPHLQDNTSTVNITDMVQVEDEGILLPTFKIFFLVIGSSCPLFVVLLSSIVIVASLYLHVCQMTGKESIFRSPQTEAHFKAARTVLFLLFLYLSFYITQIWAMVTAFENVMVFCVYCVVLIGYSLAQAAILVWVNPKLNRHLLESLQEKNLKLTQA